MIELTMDKGSLSARMEGTDREIFAEAVAIVNGLYTSIGKDSPELGELFKIRVRFDDSVWHGGVITDSVTIAVPGADAGK